MALCIQCPVSRFRLMAVPCSPTSNPPFCCCPGSLGYKLHPPDRFSLRIRKGSSRPMYNSARKVSWPLEVEPAYEVSDAHNADLESGNRLVLHSDETLGKTMQSCAERALWFSVTQRQMPPALQKNSYPPPFSGRRFEDEPSKGPGRPMHPDITRGEQVQTSSRPPSGRSERCGQPSPVLQEDYYKPPWYQNSMPWPPTQLLGEATQASNFLSRRKLLDFNGNTTEKRSYPASCTMELQPRRVESLELSSGKVAELDRQLGQAKNLGSIPRQPKMRNKTTPGAPWLDAARTFYANLQLLKAKATVLQTEGYGSCNTPATGCISSNVVTDSATLDISRHQMQISNCKDDDVLKLQRISDENAPKGESDNGKFTELQQLEAEIGLVPQTGMCDILKISPDCKASDIVSVQMATSVDANCKALELQGNGVEVVVDSHGKSLRYGKIVDSLGEGKTGHKIRQCAKLQPLQAEVKSVSQIASTVLRPQLSTLVEVQCEASEALELQRNSSQNTAGYSGLACSLEEVLIVDNLATAKAVVSRLRGDYKDFVHACDTEVADIDVKKQTPVGHGKVTCFSIYCGPQVNFEDGKTCVWVDILDGGVEVMNAFKEYFEDPSIKKVWHNFSFDKHILGNVGIKAEGFYADTMHLARLWNSGRTGAQGGYSLESLTSDQKVMNGVNAVEGNIATRKTSMKDLFGVVNVKKDGSKGKLKVIPPVTELQRGDGTRNRWICYSSGDAICTWKLWESLREKLSIEPWILHDSKYGSMYDFYERYWQPFGVLLVQMESHGMLVDRHYLAEIEKVAIEQQKASASRFREWAVKYCPDARYLNVTSDTQIRQLLYGGRKLKYAVTELPLERTFSAPNVDGYIEEGKKVPKKQRPIVIHGIGVNIPVIKYTSGGLPAVSMEVLKALAGKVSIDYSVLDEEAEGNTSDFVDSEYDNVFLTSAGVEGDTSTAGSNMEEDLSLYGIAYKAFGGGEEGKEACKAIASLCEVSAIDTLISGFIQPLQGSDVMGPDGRIHCSMNLNTETGRLSARRPNLQNQPALEKDRYKIRQAFIASPGNSLVVADYGQLELRILAHLSNCDSMLRAFKMGGDFHSRTAMNMYEHVRKAVEDGKVLLEWEPKPGEETPPVPLLKDMFAAERRKAKMLNFSIAYGKTAIGLSKDWKVSVKEAEDTVKLWYRDKKEVRDWQDKRKWEAREKQCVHTLLGRARHFPDMKSARNPYIYGHIERAAINAPVQGSAADVAMCAMLEISRDSRLKELGWKLVLQVHDEVIVEGPSVSAEEAKAIVVKAMSHPFDGKNILRVDLSVDAKYAESWYAAK